MVAPGAGLSAVAIVGPTAVGKSDVADRLAARLSSEVLSCDAMQIYRGMDIGTAKMAPDECTAPLRLVDIVEPGVAYSAALYQADARAHVERLLGSGCLPVFCGGTGLYLKAALDEMDFPSGELEDDRRVEYQELAERIGHEIKKVRGEIAAGEQATSADKVSYNGKTVQEALDDLNYMPIQITSFTNTVNVVEMGATVDTVTLKFAFNKKPKSLTLDGQQEDVNATTKELTGLGLTANKTWSLTAKDDREATSTKTTSVSFLNGAYWGIGAVEADGVTDEFVKGLQKALTGSKAREFTVNATEGQYIYYAIPTRFGTPAFFVGGFEGGFAKLKTFDFTNASGYQESYDVYRSDNVGLGSTKVTVK